MGSPNPINSQQRRIARQARTAGFAVRVSSLASALALSYFTAVSKLRRPFLSKRYFFITVRLLRRRELERGRIRPVGARLQPSAGAAPILFDSVGFSPRSWACHLRANVLAHCHAEPFVVIPSLRSGQALSEAKDLGICRSG
jgi:hypothetical protein